MRHAAARGLGHEDLARLPLGTDEEHRLAGGDDLTQLVECALKERNRLPEVEDVNPIALGIDIPTHVRVPAAGLVPKVDASL